MHEPNGDPTVERSQKMRRLDLPTSVSLLGRLILQQIKDETLRMRWIELFQTFDQKVNCTPYFRLEHLETIVVYWQKTEARRCHPRIARVPLGCHINCLQVNCRDVRWDEFREGGECGALQMAIIKQHALLQVLATCLQCWQPHRSGKPIASIALFVSMASTGLKHAL